MRINKLLSYMVGFSVLTFGFSVAYAVEGKNAYFDAIESGATQSQAEIEGMIVGSINAALELLQVEKVITFARLGAGSLKGVFDAAKKKAIRKLIKIGTNLTKKAVKLSITEGIQEALQETTSTLAPGITGRELPTGKEAAKRQIKKPLSATEAFEKYA